jgi:hypothetical protein
MKLVVNNKKPKKSVYCPVCGSSVYALAYFGRGDYDKPIKVKYCLYCLASGEVVTF